jgi:DMSO reductase family type II enzyme heme b subunit
MEARYIPPTKPEVLLDPDSPVWSESQPEILPLIGTPVGLQPTDLIRVTWAYKRIGMTSAVSVAAVHDGRTIAIRLEWQDGNENREILDTNVFADAAAILFPGVVGAPLAIMGTIGLPVNGWYWSADRQDEGRQVVAEGIGTTRTVDTDLTKGRGVWKEGVWKVVITRPLRIQTSEPIVQIEPGKPTKFGVAVWEGNNSERGGIKAYSIDWRELMIEAVPTTGS